VEQEKKNCDMLKRILTWLGKTTLSNPRLLARRRRQFEMCSRMAAPMLTHSQLRARTIMTSQGVEIECLEHRTNSSKENLDRNAILYLHGGAFVCGDPRSHRVITNRLALDCNATVYSPHYRLAPEHRYPSALDDCVHALQYIVHECHVEPSRIAVAGDSAGGNLVASLLLRLAESSSAMMPKCSVMMSPWLDLTSSGESHARNQHSDLVVPADLVLDVAKLYAAGDDLKRASPALVTDAALLGRLPPTLVQVGSSELLLSDAVTFVDNVRRAGNTRIELDIIERMQHVFQAAHLFHPIASNSFARLSKFISIELARR
jgi:epsilon-lactone hydrolase